MLLRYSALAAALTLAACNPKPGGNEARVANQIEADPALTSAIEDPILVDPTLTQQSNKNAIRPPDGPFQAQYPTDPATKGPLKGNGAMQRVATGQGSACGAKLDHDMKWATRLPQAFPVLPGARITEAAGNDAGDCRMRTVTFTANAPAGRVLDWYRQRAAAFGYTAEHQRREGDHILSGASEVDTSAYYLIVTPRRSGSEVSLIASNRG